MKRLFTLTLLAVVALVLLAGCGGRTARGAAQSATHNEARNEAASAAPDAHFTLKTGVADGQLVYIGVGGAIAGQINPNLDVAPGARVRLTVIMGDRIGHDLAVDDAGARTPLLTGQGREATIDFTAPAQPGAYPYFCSVAGHRQAGMQGMLVVRAARA